MLTLCRVWVAIGVCVLFAGSMSGGEGGSDEAKAKAAAARAELQAAEAELNLAEANLKRVEALHKQRAISAEEFERALVSHARARAAVEAVRAKQLAAKVMKAIQIAAPVGGIVAEITVKDGDKVQKGQILARLDDRKARLEVERAQTTVKNAEAEVQAAGKKTDEAQTRLEIAKRLYAKGAIAAEDLRLAELTHANSYQEFLVRKAAVQLTIVDLKQAELNLDMHVIRSPINGIIRKLHKNSGEGVRKLDTVVGVEPE